MDGLKWRSRPFPSTHTSSVQVPDDEDKSLRSGHPRIVADRNRRNLQPMLGTYARGFIAQGSGNRSPTVRRQRHTGWSGDPRECYAALPLKFEPGSKYEYSNPGINTAGRIIEVVGGLPYEEFMARRLFEPLGMKDTTFWPTVTQPQRLAKAYKPNADKTGLEEMPILPTFQQAAIKAFAE
jgi:hypothetical protein